MTASKWRILTVASATALSGVLCTSALRAQDAAQQPQTESSQTSDAASARPGTANPMPSTQQSEGTAADDTVPGATQTRAPATTPGTANPVPATRRGEGTAADRSPPGDTPVRGTAASRAPQQATSRMAMLQGDASSQRRGSTLIGMHVRDAQGQQLGTVKDVVINPTTGQITHAIVSHGDAGGAAQAMAAVPWQAAQKMMRANALVIDQAKLSSAPQLEGDQSPDLSSRSWSDAADRYWQADANANGR